MLKDFASLLSTGGIPVYGMIVLALFAVAITIERVQALYFTYGVKSDQFLTQIKNFIMNDKVEDAIASCNSQGQALLPRLTKAILERADRDDDSIKTAHEIASMEIIPLITKRLGYLAMVANVATLVGLLGTIHGLIQSFQAVSFADPAQKQTLLAQGISISMNTTAMGLFVAIPVMIIYSVLQARQNKLIEEVVGQSAKIVDCLLSRGYQPFSRESAFASSDTAVAMPAQPMPNRKAQ
jgi:biopolymer transport protein ExbB